MFYETSISESKDIAYRKTITNGTIWDQQQVIPISDSVTHEEIHDSHISDSGAIYLFVQELRNRWATFIWISLDDGQSWSKKQVTSYDNSGWGAVFIVTENLYVIYEREQDLYIVHSSNLEYDWSSAQIFTSREYQNRHPGCYSVSDEITYIVWSSNRTGDWEVYLKVFTYNQIAGQGDFTINLLLLLSFMFLSLILLFISVIMFKQIFSDIRGKMRIQPDTTAIFKLLSLFFFLFGRIIVTPTIRRLSISQVQENHTRLLILRLLEDHDFLHFRELLRKTKTGTACLKWHIKVLEDFGFINEIRFSQYLIYHLTDKPPNSLYIKTYFSLTSETAIKIASAFLEFKVWSINDLASILKISKRTVAYHCENLHRSGILAKSDKNRHSLNFEYKNWVEKVVLSKKN